MVGGWISQRLPQSVVAGIEIHARSLGADIGRSVVLWGSGIGEIRLLDRHGDKKKAGRLGKAGTLRIAGHHHSLTAVDRPVVKLKEIADGANARHLHQPSVGLRRIHCSA